MLKVRDNPSLSVVIHTQSSNNPHTIRVIKVLTSMALCHFCLLYTFCNKGSPKGLERESEIVSEDKGSDVEVGGQLKIFFLTRSELIQFSRVSANSLKDVGERER